MSDNTAHNENFDELDLSSLSSLSLEPAWASGDKKDKISVARFSHADRRGNGPRRPRERSEGGARDRRPPRRPRAAESSPREGAGEHAEGSANRRERNNARRRDDRHGHSRRPNRPLPPPRVAEVSIWPEDKPFNVLAKAIKNSARTYALFEIANLILEKPERFSLCVKPIERKPLPAKDGAPAAAPASKEAPTLFTAVPDGMPFLNEADAVAYVFERYADRFFTTEAVEVDAPKGNFTMVSKCGFTGELLAPPNYHGYQQILRDHHAANFPKMPFEKFMSRLETVRDQESIDAWIGKMKTVVRCTIKDRREGEPETIDGLSAVKTFLLSSRKSKIVRSVSVARFPGKLLEQMPMGPLKAYIEHEIAYQQRFPLQTANTLRGRLRRSGFSMFKRGAKGITLVCAIRRKFRTPDSVFSGTIQRVFDFLEKNPNTKIQDLPKKMLGIGDDVPAPAPAAPEGEVAPAEAVAAPAPASNAETEALLTDLLATVRWLVLEGYVSELSDGSLFTYPKMTAAQVKAAAKEEAAEEKAESADVPVAPEEISAETEAPAPEVPAEESPAAPAAEETSVPPAE